MSVNGLGLGRCSGALHLAVQFPKVTACLCALGLVGWTAPDIEKVVTYCLERTEATYAAIPASIQPAANKVCYCLKDQCIADQ